MSVRLQKNKKTLNFVIFINRKCSPLKTKQNNQTFQGKIFIFFKLFQGRWPLRTPPPPPPRLSVANSGKRRNKRKKERVSKYNLLKGCHQGQNVSVLAIPERLEFKNVSLSVSSVFHGPILYEIHFPALSF